MAQTDKVSMVGKGLKDPRQFTVEHAQRILDFEKRNPPKNWDIDPKETGFTIVDGKITKKTDGNTIK